MKNCSVDECERKHLALGFCRTHYGRFKRHGDPLVQVRRSSIDVTAAEQLALCVSVDGPLGCWHWTGRIDPGGYGRNGSSLAYRQAYEAFKGAIPDGLVIDHLCRVRDCVNPDHLEAVTQAENLRRSPTWSGINSSKKECKNGHWFTKENTYRDPRTGWRQCRKCVNAATLRYQARKREAV